MISNVIKPLLYSLSFMLAIGFAACSAFGGVVYIDKSYSGDNLSFGIAASPDGADTFDVVFYDGTIDNYDPAQPQLPFFSYQVILPNGSRVDSVTYAVYDPEFIEAIHGRYQVYPCQHYPESPQDEAEWVEPDEETYSSSDSYVDKQAWLITGGKQDGFISFAQVAVCPFDYFPAQDSLVIYEDVDINVHYTLQTTDVPHSRTLLSQKVYQDLYDYSDVVNDPDKPASGYLGSDIPELDSIWTLPSSGNNYPHRFYEYSIVVTTTDVAEALEDLVTWKRQKGVECGIVFADSIRLRTACPDIPDNAGYLRTWIRDGYKEGKLTYVLLAGDADIHGDDPAQIPVRYGHCFNSEDQGWLEACKINGPRLDCTWPPPTPEDCCARFWVPSDFYFTELDNDWDVDGDEFYGEAPSTAPPGYDEEMFQDGYGEVFVGRIPTDNTEMIRYWVDKLITYEKNPGWGDYSYLESVLSIQADGAQTFDHGRRMQEWLPMTWEKHIIEEDGGGFCCESSYPEGHHVSDSINAVHPHYITDHSHGSINAIQIMAQGQACKPEAYIACGFDTCLSNNFYGYIPAPGKYDFFDIEEGPYYSIMNVAACHTADFAVAEYDPDFIQCFGALFLFVPGRGGVAYMGDTKTGFWIPQFMGMEHFINVGFLGNYMDYGNRLGPAFDASRAMVEVPFHSLDMDLRRHKYYLNYTLLGDPEMPIWGGQPDHFRVDVIRLDNVADTVRVMKSNGSPVSGAYVCVNFNETAYYVNFTGESGIFVLPESIHDLDGSELITITARNMIPCQIYGDKELTDNTLWTGDVTVLDSVLVSGDARLTIHPGSRIRFKRNAFLRVYGEIEAVDESGMPEREIIFTADTTGAVPHDFWMGIHICYGASVHFQNCRVSYGDYGLYVNQAVDCSVKHCDLSNNNYHGLFIRGRGLHPGWIEGCHLDSNTICGIKAYGFNVFIADTMINNGIFGYYRFTSGGDSLADCVVEYDGDDYDITRWGMYIEFRGSAQVTKHVAVTGGRVTGYKQGGIKVLRADSESIIGGGINLDDNGIYGLYLENTDISVLGGTEPISCNRIIGNRYGLYSYNGTGIYRLNYFDNDSVNVWVRPAGIYGRLPVVSDYNTFQQAKVLVKNYSYSTLNATRNYWPDQQGSILGPVDTSYSLAFDPCSQSKIAGLDQIPAIYALHQNYPNPFNPTTVMEYDLPGDSHVKITIYNILGQKVKVLVDEYQTAGYRAVQWDGCNDYGLEVSTGVYFYLMEAGKYRSAKKMLMLK